MKQVLTLLNQHKKELLYKKYNAVNAKQALQNLKLSAAQIVKNDNQGQKLDVSV